MENDISIIYDASRNLAVARKLDVGTLIKGDTPALRLTKDISTTKFLKKLRNLGIDSEAIDAFGRVVKDVYLEFRDGGWVANFLVRGFSDTKVTLESPEGVRDSWDLNAYFFGLPEENISLIDECSFNKATC